MTRPVRLSPQPLGRALQAPRTPPVSSSRHALRAGAQLRPLGPPRPAAAGRHRRLRARPGRPARRRPGLRRRRGTRL